MKITTLATLILLSGFTFGQDKTKLDHTIYDSWKTIGAIKQSPSGKLIGYETNPHKGDGLLTIQSTDRTIDTVFNRGVNIGIHHSERFVVFTVKPEFDTIRSLKLEKVKEDQFPKDTLVIYYPAEDSINAIPNVKSFQLTEEGDWLAYLSEKDERPDCPKKKCKLFKKKNKCGKVKTSGTTLHLINPVTAEAFSIDRVVSYRMDRKGKQIVYTTSEKGDADSLAVHQLFFRDRADHILIDKQLKIKSITFDRDGDQLLFLHSTDTNKRKVFELSYWSTALALEKIVDSTTNGLPEGHTISEHFRPYFSQDGKNLFVGIAPIVEQEPEDTLLDSEKARVDIWSGFDLKIQPQQLKSKGQDLKKTFLCRYDVAGRKVIQLGDDEIERVRTLDNGNSNMAIGFSSKPYKKAVTWDFPWKEDIYLLDLTTGERRKIKDGHAYSSNLSPSGSHFIWYEGADSSWYSKPAIKSADSTNLTAGLNALFASDVNGNPFIPFSEGASGWTLIDDTEYYLVNSRFDVWALCPAAPDRSFSLSKREGQKNKITYRLRRFDYDSTYTDVNKALLYGINDETKSESYTSIACSMTDIELHELINTPHKFTYLSKAKESDQVLFRRMNFNEYPELETTNMRFENPQKISETNPQQKDYNWGTVEMISWTSFEGRALQGLLYKPEDFDSTKSYPMIVYFYEKYSDNIHLHYIPKPTASIVYPTEYVSNGYLIFIPDIEYTPGYPAASAYDCIVSGTDYLTRNFSYVDSTRLGLQGQSWGGYQTAQLITMTNKYKAAMAGAPVSNMFSAYGGIRWGSGLSRMFQYERTQSRIGYTIWEKPELYIENSPLFGLPNVETPLLIMHNDGDGAVPWYQGIELYMGLRRLNQPVWLLNYNDDQHNLMKNANREDLSIRMRQFFDHYLLDAESPVWMEEGVPAIDKGKNYGLGIKKK